MFRELVILGVTLTVVSGQYSDDWAENSSPLLPFVKTVHKLVFNQWEKYYKDRPVTRNTFQNFLESISPVNSTCGIHDEVLMLLKSFEKQNQVECQTERTFNKTRNIESIPEFMNVLAPFGNRTKRTLPGNCVFVLFYTKSCVTSHMAAIYFFDLPLFFPNIQFVMIDSLNFYRLNADFGITGLPTLMLFHQGKTVRKMNLELDAQLSTPGLVVFLWKSTNLRPLTNISAFANHPVKDDLPQFSYPAPDPYLAYAWAFIWLCIFYSMIQTATFTKFTGSIKRMWQEYHEHQHVE